jgi:succinoglycan biosynthesis protein ExoV
MRLYVWRGTTRNFGDELNELLWPHLLPGRFDDALFDDGGSDLFLGIGSVLDARPPADRRKIVAGAGFGGYENPASLDESWEIYWVRGPRTARQLGLPTAFGLGDPASLLPLVHPVARHDTGAIGFMPHFESLARGAWPEAATAAGVTLIDPRNAPHTILDQIAGCRMLLSEALHGVIVADALRIPWVALAPVAPIHRAKWLDWAEALDLTIRFHALPASSPREYIETAFTPRRHAVRAGLARAAALANRIDRRTAHLDRAADSLRQATIAPPQLSNCRALTCAQDHMLDRVHLLRASHDARGLDHRLDEARSGLRPETRQGALPPGPPPEAEPLDSIRFGWFGGGGEVCGLLSPLQRTE